MATAHRLRIRRRSYLFVFTVLGFFLVLAHGPLLTTPYYWDEAGQFIPAALDIYRMGAWIPVSVVPNVHPPGVMAYLAAFWTVFGFSIVATRVAMLIAAAMGALAVFLLGIELSRGSTGAPAFTALALLCFSPLFFAQSMLAQLDMPAMGLTCLALLLFLQNRFRDSALACMALVMVRETGAVIPAVLGLWLAAERRPLRERAEALWFLLPFPALGGWLLALHHATGHWGGNAQFENYNLQFPLNPARMAVALVRRAYYLFIGTGHWIGTAVVVYAFRRVPIMRDRAWRITAAVAAAHVLTVSMLGGAVLERYLLPVLPVIYIAFAVGLQALRPRPRMLALAGLLICLVLANAVNPPYSFPFENNLAFVSFVQLERDAALAVEERPGSVATVFPVAHGLRNPDLGFVDTRRRVTEMADFTAPEVEKLKAAPPDMVVVFTRTWDPFGLLKKPMVEKFLQREYGYQPERTADEIADTLSMTVTHRWERRGLGMELLEKEPRTIIRIPQ